MMFITCLLVSALWCPFILSMASYTNTIETCPRQIHLNKQNVHLTAQMGSHHNLVLIWAIAGTDS